MHNPIILNARLLTKIIYIPHIIINADKTISVFEEFELLFAPLIELINKVMPLNKIHAPIIILISASTALENITNNIPRINAIKPIPKSLMEGL